MVRMKTIGVLALQGAFEKHMEKIEKIGAVPLNVRNEKELDTIDALIIPGGESTTIGKLLVRFNMLQKIKSLIEKGLPVFGTCAGMILLAKDIENSDQVRIGKMDIKVSRNAYGSQTESFETQIQVPEIKKSCVKAIFIRAPRIVSVEKNVDVLSVYENTPVFIRQNNMLAASFHPELTDDTSIHEYFLKMC